MGPRPTRPGSQEEPGTHRGTPAAPGRTGKAGRGPGGPTGTPVLAGLHVFPGEHGGAVSTEGGFESILAGTRTPECRVHAPRGSAGPPPRPAPGVSVQPPSTLTAPQPPGDNRPGPRSPTRVGKTGPVGENFSPRARLSALWGLWFPSAVTLGFPSTKVIHFVLSAEHCLGARARGGGHPKPEGRAGFSRAPMPRGRVPGRGPRAAAAGHRALTTEHWVLSTDRRALTTER